MLGTIFEALVAHPYAVLGICAGCLSVVAFYPYVRSVFRAGTRPDRATWLVWSVLGSVSLAGQVYEGATASLWFVGVQVGGTILVSILSIWRGHGAFLTLRNLAMYVIAAIGLVLWYQMETAIYAIAIAIAISLMGGLVTVGKAYRAPQTECPISWTILLLASICAVFSVAGFDPVLLAYPMYLLTLYLAVVMAMYLGRIRQIYDVPFRTSRNLAAPPPSASAVTAAPLVMIDAWQIHDGVQNRERLYGVGNG